MLKSVSLLVVLVVAGFAVALAHAADDQPDLIFRRSKGLLGIAEQVSDVSLSCRQVGPIRFKDKFAQGDDMFRKRRSLIFKKMQIVRGCDTKRNVLVYMVYSDRLIEGSPKNSTAAAPIMPWGGNDQIQKCADFVEK